MLNTETKKVFIASSTAVKDDKKVDVITKELAKAGFNPHPWHKQFFDHEYILEELIRTLKEVDFAIFYFAEDWKIIKKESDAVDGFQYGTVSNVILEYGMFLIGLGKKRIRIIQDGNPAIPTDISGLLLNRTHKSTEADIKKQLKKIIKEWNSIPSRDDKYGVSKPIFEYKHELDDVLNSITNYQHSNNTNQYLRIDDRLLVSLYRNGLERIQYRFWTTTYLTSGFWTHGRQDVTEANKKMLEHVSNHPKRDVRRVFLLRSSVSDMLRALGVEIELCKANPATCREKLLDIETQLEKFKEVCDELKSMGCKIKYFYDEKAYRSVKGFRQYDTEIAIYDDFRIDFFDGGSAGKISGLRILTETNHNFINEKAILENYFIKVYDDTQDIDDLLNAIQKTYDYYSQKIDYNFPKLLEYDKDLNKIDKKTKTSELRTVLKYLKNQSYISNVSHYLDIGTCTGRYPFALYKILTKNNRAALITAIDADVDCINYSNAQKKIKQKNGIPINNIKFVTCDFLLDDRFVNGKFELITCMLGTISHFGWNKDVIVDDDLKLAIDKMANLLTPDGVLVLSNWTPLGLNDDILSIYTPAEREKLNKFTESHDKLQERLSHHFEVKRQTITNGRLDIYFCRKNAKKKKTKFNNPVAI